MTRGGRASHRAPTLLLHIALLAAAAIAGVLSLRLAGPVEGDVGPGRVALAARADTTPRTELLLPPLGSCSRERSGRNGHATRTD